MSLPPSFSGGTIFTLNEFSDTARPKNWSIRVTFRIVPAKATAPGKPQNIKK